MQDVVSRRVRYKPFKYSQWVLVTPGVACAHDITLTGRGVCQWDINVNVLVVAYVYPRSIVASNAIARVCCDSHRFVLLLEIVQVGIRIIVVSSAV